jgi:hypothetical protein
MRVPRVVFHILLRSCAFVVAPVREMEKSRWLEVARRERSPWMNCDICVGSS